MSNFEIIYFNTIKKLLYILLFVPLAFFGQENNLYHIPDTNFLSCLQENHPALIINDSLDIDEANLTASLNLNCNSFNNFDGIQYFVNLNSLFIQFDNDDETGLDNFSNIDISSLNNLEDLWIWEANISELSLPNPSNLIGIEILGSNLPDSIGIINHPNLSEFDLLLNGGIKHLVLSELPNLNNLDIIENFTLNSLSLSQLSSNLTTNNILIYCNSITCVDVYDEQANDFLIEYECTGDSLFYGDLALCEYNYGCTDSQYFEYDLNANIDDGSCMNLWLDAYQILNNQATNSISTLQQALDTWNTTIDLSAGWNMFGYGCPTSIDLVQGLSNHTELIAMVKDNNGSAYIPEFDFNGIGDLTPGFGYQIKVTEAIEGFSLCDWYVNDIPEDNIVSLQEENASLQAELDSIYGCVNENACNFDVIASLDDGSCYHNDLGCGCGNPAAQEGYDCDGNEIELQIGVHHAGGYIFQINDDGTGLVADLQDLGPMNWYESLDAAYDATSQGYDDWYLPSLEELQLMYTTIGQGGPAGNIGGFENNWYWSSSDYNVDNVWYVSFDDGLVFGSHVSNPVRVRVIRAF